MEEQASGSMSSSVRRRSMNLAALEFVETITVDIVTNKSSWVVADY